MHTPYELDMGERDRELREERIAVALNSIATALERLVELAERLLARKGKSK